MGAADETSVAPCLDGMRMAVPVKVAVYGCDLLRDPCRALSLPSVARSAALRDDAVKASIERDLEDARRRKISIQPGGHRFPPQVHQSNAGVDINDDLRHEISATTAVRWSRTA